jgi:hypothetical protein
VCLRTNFSPLGIFLFSGLQGFIIARKVAVEVNSEKSKQSRHLFRLMGISDSAYRDAKILFTLIVNFLIFVANLTIVLTAKILLQKFRSNYQAEDYCTQSVIRILVHHFVYFMALPSFYLFVGLLIPKKSKHVPDLVSLVQGIFLMTGFIFYDYRNAITSSNILRALAIFPSFG